MQPSKLLALTALAILAPAAVVALWGVSSIARETERARARYGEQSTACASSVRDALLAVLREGGGDALAWRTDRDGTLLEPALAPWRFEVEEDVIGLARAEIDAFELDGELERTRERLRELAGHEDRPELAAWALTSLAAIEARAGATEAGEAARRELIARFPEVRDSRGLRRAHAARFALLASDADAAALLADLIEDRAALEHTAPAMLAGRIADRLRASASPELAALETRARERTRELTLAATWPTGISDWIARGAPGASASFDLAVDPLAPVRQRVLVSASAGDETGCTGTAREHADIARLALARPEIDAWRALGFLAEVASDDGAMLAGERAPSDATTAEQQLDAPLDGLRVRAFGTDFEGFVARERRRLLLIASFAGIAWLVAAMAAFATVRAVAREARAAKQRQDFVAAVTHELKAPLASIRLFAELLERGGVEEHKVREFGARTVAESDRLSRVVSSVLELARIEQRSNGSPVPANRQPVDLAALARDVVRSFEPRAAQLGFTLELRTDFSPLREIAGMTEAASVPRSWIDGDADALRGALSELIDNALVHAREPHALEAEVACDERTARVVVLDRGPGVPAGERERIFEAFCRVGDELVRERPGVGLGLALVARVAAAHGGRAYCEPRDGGGSRFVIELPRSVPQR